MPIKKLVKQFDAPDAWSMLFTMKTGALCEYVAEIYPSYGGWAIQFYASNLSRGSKLTSLTPMEFPTFIVDSNEKGEFKRDTQKFSNAEFFKLARYKDIIFDWAKNMKFDEDDIEDSINFTSMAEGGYYLT